MPKQGSRKKKYDYVRLVANWDKNQYSDIVDGIPISCSTDKKEKDQMDDSLFTDLEQSSQFLCENWVRYGLERTKNSVLDITSYGLKHILHHDTGVYLTNNQFKHLMILMGYDPVDKKELNWRFHVSKRSPALKKKKVK